MLAAKLSVPLVAIAGTVAKVALVAAPLGQDTVNVQLCAGSLVGPELRKGGLRREGRKPTAGLPYTHSNSGRGMCHQGRSGPAQAIIDRPRRVGGSTQFWGTRWVGTKAPPLRAGGGGLLQILSPGL